MLVTREMDYAMRVVRALDGREGLATAAGVPLVLSTHKGAAPAYLNISKRLLGQRVPLLRIR